MTSKTHVLPTPSASFHLNFLIFDAPYIPHITLRLVQSIHLSLPGKLYQPEHYGL